MDRTPFCVEVRVDSLEGLFSALDPSPFRQRDLDPRAVEHIVQWASDAPAHRELKLLVSVADHADPAATEHETEEAVRRFFAYEASLLERRYRRNTVRMVRWLTIGVTLMTILLALHSAMSRLFPDSVLNDIVGEAFVIAGWVSLWVPIERLGFDGWLLKDQFRLYQRLARMDVEVVS